MAPTKPTVRATRCSQCNAPVEFDASLRALRCSHCGHRETLEASGGEQVEHDLTAGLQHFLETTPRGFDTPTRSVRCQQCGATIVCAPEAVTAKCDFCGGNCVLAPEASEKAIRPAALVPFSVDQKTAQAHFIRWLRGLWLRPTKLKHLARVVEMKGVYVPYWTFDATAESRWVAESGTYYYETESYVENGQRRTRQVQRVRWSPAAGSRRDRYDDFILCASRGLQRDLAHSLQTFDTTKLVSWDARFLLGWHAEEYAIGLEDAWNESATLLDESQRRRCAADVPGDTHRSLQVRTRFSEQTFKHVLLPVWISSYRYGDKLYQFLVNGQTGEVRGHAPWSVWKIAALVITLLLLALLFASQSR